MSPSIYLFGAFGVALVINALCTDIQDRPAEDKMTNVLELMIGLALVIIACALAAVQVV